MIDSFHLISNVAIFINDISVLGGAEKVTSTLFIKLQQSFCPDIKLICLSNKNNNKLLKNQTVLLDGGERIFKNCRKKLLKEFFLKNEIKYLIVEIIDLKTAVKVAKLAYNMNIKVLFILHNTPFMYLNDFSTVEYCFYFPVLFLKKCWKFVFRKIPNYFKLNKISKIGKVITVGYCCERELKKIVPIKTLDSQTIYNIVDLNPGNVKKHRSKNILFLGRFSLQKNLLLLLKIWKEINKLLPDYHLFLVGEGEQKYKIMKITEKWKIKNIEFSDKISKVKELYQKSDVCILTSFFEGLPTVFLEAIRQNCAIFATKGYGGMAELASYGIGKYVDSTDPWLIASLLKDFLVDLTYPYESPPLPMEFSENYILSKWHDVLSGV